MALLHAASIRPSKAEMVGALLDRSAWAAGSDTTGEVELVGAYRFDDPSGAVGLETHLVRRSDGALQVPLTYRDAPCDAATAGLVGTMEHSVLGRRWVYDGMHDPVYATMLAVATLTGVGQSVEVLQVGGRFVTRRASVRLGGGGWRGAAGETIAVDAFGPPEEDDGWTVVRSPELELRLARRPRPGSAPIGLTGTWAGQDEPSLLATVVLRRT